jgi:hypothetical protein
MALLFNCVLACSIRKAHENYVALKLNMTYQLMAYADDLNL